MKRASVLVVSATAAEATHVPAGIDVVVTGIGKTAAAAATTEALLGLKHVSDSADEGAKEWRSLVDKARALGEWLTENLVEPRPLETLSLRYVHEPCCAALLSYPLSS